MIVFDHIPQNGHLVIFKMQRSRRTSGRRVFLFQKALKHLPWRCMMALGYEYDGLVLIDFFWNMSLSAHDSQPVLARCKIMEPHKNNRNDNLAARTIFTDLFESVLRRCRKTNIFVIGKNGL